MSALFADDECGPRVATAQPVAPRPSRPERIRAAGEHPASLRPLLPEADAKTCGGCTYRKQLADGGAVLYRCTLGMPAGQRRGRAQTDDPACVAWHGPLLTGQTAIAEPAG